VLPPYLLSAGYQHALALDMHETVSRCCYFSLFSKAKSKSSKVISERGCRIGNERLDAKSNNQNKSYFVTFKPSFILSSCQNQLQCGSANLKL